MLNTLLRCRIKTFSTSVLLYPYNNSLKESFRVPLDTVKIKYSDFFYKNSNLKEDEDRLIRVPLYSDFYVFSNKFKLNTKSVVYLINFKDSNLLDLLKFWFVFSVVYQLKTKIIPYSELNLSDSETILTDEIESLFDLSDKLKVKTKDLKKQKSYDMLFQGNDSNILINATDFNFQFAGFNLEDRVKFIKDKTLATRETIEVRTIFYVDEIKNFDLISLEQNKFLVSKSKSSDSIIFAEVIPVPTSYFPSVSLNDNPENKEFIDYYFNNSDIVNELKSINLNFNRTIFILSGSPLYNCFTLYLLQKHCACIYLHSRTKVFIVNELLTDVLKHDNIRNIFSLLHLKLQLPKIMLNEGEKSFKVLPDYSVSDCEDSDDESELNRTKRLNHSLSKLLDKGYYLSNNLDLI